MVKLLPTIIIVSQYGMRTLSYINGGKPLFHKGVDIRAFQGTQILAPCDVDILRHGRGQYGENFIVAKKADEDIVFKFIHCTWPSTLRAGARIPAGAVIAISDGSGTTDGKGGKAPHLHFETWHGKTGSGKDQPFNPEDLFKVNGISFEYSAELKKRLGI